MTARSFISSHRNFRRFFGRNASCCDFKQLFPRLAGDALHGETGEQFNRRLAGDGQTVGALIPADPGFGDFADSFVRAQRALSGRGQASLQRFAILQRQTGRVWPERDLKRRAVRYPV